MQEKDFDRLVERYLNNDATPLERELVEAHVRLLEDMSEEKLSREELALRKSIVWARLRPGAAVHRISFVSRFRWVAAAVFVLALGGIWFAVNRESEVKAVVVAKVDVKAPVSNRAMVTLGDGQTVYLDSALNGQLAMQGDVKLVKLADGQVVYTGSSDKVVFNTLTNPKGSRPIDIGLSDGSHVWLNAGSSITYPVAFAANIERRVSMTGEAYYEIMHRDGLGFVVQKENTEVRVLGTHFNVKAYDNEPDLKVTLLEGSVRVTRNAKSLTLKPNQQAVVTSNDLQLNEDADTEQAMAWKNGMTSFHSASVATILREIERWYNIETKIKGTAPDLSVYSFYVDVSRSAPLTDILKVLELNHVKYEYDAEKRKLVVIP